MVVVVWDSLGHSSRSERGLPSSAYRHSHPIDLARDRNLPVPLKLHPTLASWVLTKPQDLLVDVVVTFVDTVTIPRFPDADPAQDRGSTFNRAVFDTARMLIDSLRVRRAAQYAIDVAEIETVHHGVVVETFWLAQAALVQLPLGQVTALSNRSSVLYVAPNQGDGAPAADSTVQWAADQLGMTVGYFKNVRRPLWITLLDSGVESRHHLLFDPNGTPRTRLCLVTDCTRDPQPAYPPPTACSSFDPADGATEFGGDPYPKGHGTASAAILVGNRRLGADYEGIVPSATLDCIRVFNDDQSLNRAAACRGMQLAVGRCNQVIVSVMDDTTSRELADVSVFADHAFQTGRAVIAANGNSDKMAPGIPARDPLVLGIGAYNPWAMTVETNRAHGPTLDLRVKPDVLAFTLTETASLVDLAGNFSLDGLGYYSATSGATPYGAGLAGLLQQWIAPFRDPGLTYALMILSGDQVGPFALDSQSGAGVMSLPPAGRVAYGKVWITPSQPDAWVDIPSNLARRFPDPWRLDAAIWWPEPAVTTGKPADHHNDIDLLVENQYLWLFHTVSARSDAENGVFEKVRVDISRRPWWQWIRAVLVPSYSLRIHAKTMCTGGQWVYWALSTR